MPLGKGAAVKCTAHRNARSCPAAANARAGRRTGERIAFSYLISNKFVGEEATLGVLRNGQELSLDVK